MTNTRNKNNSMIYNRKTNRLKENVKSINMYLNTNENGEGRKEK